MGHPQEPKLPHDKKEMWLEKKKRAAAGNEGRVAPNAFTVRWIAFEAPVVGVELAAKGRARRLAVA